MLGRRHRFRDEGVAEGWFAMGIIQQGLKIPTKVVEKAANLVTGAGKPSEPSQGAKPGAVNEATDKVSPITEKLVYRLVFKAAKTPQAKDADKINEKLHGVFKTKKDALAEIPTRKKQIEEYVDRYSLSLVARELFVHKYTSYDPTGEMIHNEQEHRVADYNEDGSERSRLVDKETVAKATQGDPKALSQVCASYMPNR